MSTHTPIPGTDAQGHHIPAEHLTNGYRHPNQILQAGHCGRLQLLQAAGLVRPPSPA